MESIFIILDILEPPVQKFLNSRAASVDQNVWVFNLLTGRYSQSPTFTRQHVKISTRTFENVRFQSKVAFNLLSVGPTIHSKTTIFLGIHLMKKTFLFLLRGDVYAMHKSRIDSLQDSRLLNWLNWYDGNIKISTNMLMKATSTIMLPPLSSQL